MKNTIIRTSLILLILLTTNVILAPSASAATRELYWVGNSGNWSEIAHWSLASGGVGGEAVPDADDNVHVDANSFTIAGQSLNIGAEASCKTMVWTGVTNTPALSGAATINVYGDCTLVAGMTIPFTGETRMRATGSLTTAGLTLNGQVIVYAGVGDTVTFADDVAVSGLNQIRVWQGTLDTNGKECTCAVFDTSAAGWTCGLTLGASVLNVLSWNIRQNITINAGTSTIKVRDTGYFRGRGYTYNNLELNGTSHLFYDSNTFASLNGDSTITQTLTFTDGTNQTVTDADLGGTAGNIHTLTGTGVAGWTITYAGTENYIIADYIDLSYSTGSPADTWSYWTHSTEGAGVVDWGVPFLYINIDGGDWEDYNKTVSVPDNSENWTFISGNSMPYADSITISVNGTQQLWFEPTTMVNVSSGDGSGILPDRSGNSNTGNITWGSNPAGVGVTLGSFTSSGQPSIGIATDTSTSDILPVVGGTDWRPDTGVSATLLANPMRPIVTAVSDNTTLSEYQVWVWYGIIFVVFITVLVGANVRGHHLITGIAMFVAMLLMVVWTVFPWWTLTIAVVVIWQGIVSERSPSL